MFRKFPYWCLECIPQEAVPRGYHGICKSNKLFIMPGFCCYNNTVTMLTYQKASVPQIFAQKQVVMMSRQMSHQFLHRFEIHGAKTTAISTGHIPTARTYHISMHRAQMLEKVSFLLEHGDTQTTRERFFACMDS